MKEIWSIMVTESCLVLATYWLITKNKNQESIRVDMFFKMQNNF